MEKWYRISHHVTHHVGKVRPKLPLEGFDTHCHILDHIVVIRQNYCREGPGELCVLSRECRGWHSIEAFKDSSVVVDNIHDIFLVAQPVR